LKTKRHNGPAKRKIKILIVDDLEFPRMIIRNMLQELGYSRKRRGRAKLTA
jgi:CheY-like chemotaxis protein